jgi:hypothetical protein
MVKNGRGNSTKTLASPIRNRNGSSIRLAISSKALQDSSLVFAVAVTLIEASTAFRLLTPLQSVPIFAALQSVG